MIIGIPKETKDKETRVGLTPKWVRKLVIDGHKVFIEKDLGKLAKISDSDYIAAGAEVVEKADDIYNNSEFVVKLKDYTQTESNLPFKEGQIIATFFHLGEVEPDHKMVDRLLEAEIIGVSFELIKSTDGSRPIIRPMSEIAGSMSMILASHFSQAPYGGNGVCLSSINGIKKPKVVILGGGTSGLSAAKVAQGMDCNVIVFEKLYDRIEYLRNTLYKSQILLWNKEECLKNILDCDVLINAIYPQPGMELPVISRKNVKTMKKGSVIIDLAGCNIIETIRYTTISEPSYIEEGVVHICVDNLPALVPSTSCEAFSQSIYPYVETIANYGMKKACEMSKELSGAMSFVKGKIVHKDIADTHGMQFTEFSPMMLG